MLQRYKMFLNGCNITTFFDTIQSFFLSEYHKKHIKYNLLSERNENLYTIKRCRILIAVKIKKEEIGRSDF